MAEEDTITKPDPDLQTDPEPSEQLAAYKAQRDSAIRRAHAFQTILEHHGVDLACVTPQALDLLPIADGRVDGVFAYDPPPPVKKTPPPPTEPSPNGAGAEPTLEDIRKLTPSAINELWKEGKIQSVLKDQKE